jgi:hypothetical protein
VSDERLQKAKTVRRQSEGAPSRGVDGTCLAQAAAYIRERLSKRSPVHNTSPPGDMEEPPSKAAKAEVGQQETDAIREGTMRATEYVPHAKAAPTLPISLLARPMRASRYHNPTSEPKCNGCAPDLPSMSVTPARPNNDLIFNKVIAQPMDAVRSLVRFEDICWWPKQVADNKTDEGALTPCSTEGPTSRTGEKKIECCCMNTVSEKTTNTTECSPPSRDEPLAPSTSGSPASPNNDLLSKRIICQLCLPSLKTWEDVRGELLIKAVCEPTQLSEETPIEGDPFKPKLPDTTAAKWPDQEVVGGKTTNVTLCSPYAIASPSSPKRQPIRCCQAVQQGPMLNAISPLMKVSGNKGRRPGQVAISRIEISACLHLPESTAALTPLRSEPVNQPPANFPCWSPQVDTRLRWKPPDHGGNKRRQACHVINKTSKLSVITRSPEASMVVVMSTLE